MKPAVRRQGVVDVGEDMIDLPEIAMIGAVKSFHGCHD
jgi:hypothetical protein